MILFRLSDSYDVPMSHPCYRIDQKKITLFGNSLITLLHEYSCNFGYLDIEHFVTIFLSEQKTPT